MKRINKTYSKNYNELSTQIHQQPHRQMRRACYNCRREKKIDETTSNVNKATPKTMKLL